MFGVLAMMILAPIAAGAVADGACPVRVSSKPTAAAPSCSVTGEPLARALEKIDAYAKQVPMNIDPAHATAYIINPLTGRRANFANLFQTHPPTTERVARLRHQHVH